MRARNWTFICCAVASAAATGAAMAQSGSCATAPAAVVGDNVYICDGAFPNQLTQASLAGGTTTIYKAGWFSFTPASTGSYTLSVCGSNADTKMAIGTACAASATTTFNVLAYNDDSCAFTGGTGLWASRLNNSNTGIPLTTDLQAGVTYYVAIGGFGSATIPAAGTLTISAAGGGGGGGGGGGCDPTTNTEMFVGPNDFTSVAGSGDLDLTGICDPGPFGTDLIYNVTYYRFTPPATDIWTLTTCEGTGWDTRVAVLGSCDPTSTIGCNDDDDACPNFQSTLEFNGTAGTEVVIAVGGYSAADSGPGILTIIQGSTAIPCGDPNSGDCCVANGTPSCSDEACCNSVCAADAFCCDVEWDQVCADQAAFLCGACGAGSCKITTGDVVEVELCGEDFNGGCNGGGTELAAVGNVINGTFWADADTRDTDWYLLSLSEATEVTLMISANMPCFAAFVDTGCAGILGSITNGNCGGTTTLCLPPGDIYVVALPAVFSGFPCGFEFGNDYALSVSGISCPNPAPANDNCADATVAVLGANPFDNTFAATEFADPTCGFQGIAFLKDVWFTFTPATSGFYNLETCSGATPFDTGIEVWDGCPVKGGMMLACNDDGAGCPAFASSLDVDMTAGVTYTIRVGGWDGDAGATDLNISVSSGPPTNDECSGAIALAVGTTAFSTVGASGTTPACTKFGNANIYNDLWYSYTAEGDGNCTISLCGATFDTKIAVFDGCGGALVACNDDLCELQSELSFTPTCGTTYLISVGAFGAAGFGSGDIALTQDGTCGTACPSDLDGDGFVSAADLSALLGNWGNSGTGDIDGDGFVNAADLSLLLSAWGPCV